jgi:hypothetical protein
MQITSASHALLHLIIMQVYANALILVMLWLVVLALVLHKLRCIIIIVMLVIYSIVHFVRLIQYVILVHLRLSQLPVEELLVYVLTLMFNQVIPVYVRMAMSRTTDNVHNVHYSTVHNVKQSQLAKLAKHHS